jgi:DNA primase
MLKQAICPKKQQNFLDWELSKEKARQTNIVYVAEQLGMKVKSQGRNFIARCPFHEDKNPSFYLYSDTNKFYCFGCGEHGDVIDLYMKLAGVEFKTAVKELAG